MTARITGSVVACLLLLTSDARAGDVVDFAASLIGQPYVWGAEGPHAFDCSGLTQYAYGKFGIELPRRAVSQSRIGDPAGRRLQRGDLLFFSTDPGQSLVTHVGLYEGGGMMINASRRHGRVRRDSLSDPYWVERLVFGRRVGSWGAAGRLPERDDDHGGDRPRRSSDRRRTAMRVLQRVADALFERPGR